LVASADQAIQASGYAATTMESVARRAGISIKTLYRIIPHKADLLRELVSDRFERFAVEFRLRVPDRTGIEEGLNAALIFCADFALHPEIIGLQCIILQETSRFPDLLRHSTKAASCGPLQRCQNGFLVKYRVG
jgi:AcrR family transcriptional regulator